MTYFFCFWSYSGDRRLVGRCEILIPSGPLAPQPGSVGGECQGALFARRPARKASDIAQEFFDPLSDWDQWIDPKVVLPFGTGFGILLWHGVALLTERPCLCRVQNQHHGLTSSRDDGEET